MTEPLAPPPAACALTELDPACGTDVEVVLDAEVWLPPVVVVVVEPGVDAAPRGLLWVVPVTLGTPEPVAPAPPAAPSTSKVAQVAVAGTLSVNEPAVEKDSDGRPTVWAGARDAVPRYPTKPAVATRASVSLGA